MIELVDSDELARKYRTASIRRTSRELLIARLADSEQVKDLTAPPNCDGYGRVRHFRMHSSERWVPNPLPIVPAANALGGSVTDEVRAQVFQNPACNWRCWYCYVPFNLLAADESRAGWLTAESLVEKYASIASPPRILDLSGGQPDLVPEWVPWMMTELAQRGMEHSVYVWSDDNLSSDYFWRYLSGSEIETVRNFRNYGRVGCFKGFDHDSFEFNTSAAAGLFDRQFEVFGRLLDLGIDLYAYVTLTCPGVESIESGIPRFFDRLQALHENLPLRTVPLEVQVFTPVRRRLNITREASLDNQYQALERYMRELERRFSPEDRAKSVSEVSIRSVEA